MDKKKLAVIHIVKKELNLSDEEYRQILNNVAGVTSSKELDDSQFHKLMRFFVKTRHYKQVADGITFRQKLYIKDLQKRLAWSENHFYNFLEKYYHMDTLSDFTRQQASHLITSLKRILETEK